MDSSCFSNYDCIVLSKQGMGKSSHLVILSTDGHTHE